MHNTNETSSKSRDRERQLQELKEQVRILQRQHDAEEKRERERARTSSVAAATAAAVAVTKTSGTTPAATTATATAITSDVPVPDPGGLSADGIALRSTLRLLMLQRDRAKRDIHSLEEMREAALKEPLEFVEFIQSQKARGRGSRTNSGSDNNKKPNIFAGKELPKPQEIYKCPNIEWSQYKILGAPLDALHEKHLRRPSPSRPNGQAAPGVPPSMQTGGIIGMPEYGDESGVMQGRLRMFDGLVQRGGVVGR
ncbi:hypothetical protein BDD12DRAFT_733619 [Trichophaea hybrida]|nr:hypothetical protein BDD12DRAFT_733619 [Trichophaea hybrida]